jgi:hypothetical protein
VRQAKIENCRLYRKAKAFGHSNSPLPLDIKFRERVKWQTNITPTSQEEPQSDVIASSHQSTRTSASKHRLACDRQHQHEGESRLHEKSVAIRNDGCNSDAAIKRSHADDEMSCRCRNGTAKSDESPKQSRKPKMAIGMQ